VAVFACPEDSPSTGVVLLVCGIASLVAALPAGAFLPDTVTARRAEEGAAAVVPPGSEAGQ
jgi:hypothetical protein